jgi:MFS family permease
MGDATDRPPGTRGGWVNVGVAAVLMVATFPGRSHGLGLITDPVLEDFQLDPVYYGHINLWASLLGALFCLPCGSLIDRLGTRPVLAGVVIGLGASVLVMSAVHTVWALAVLILLTRGLGQSALSVVSLGIVGKPAFRNRGAATGVFAVLVGIGFAAAVASFQSAEIRHGLGWRELWFCISIVLLLGVLPLSWALLAEPGDDSVTPAVIAASDFGLSAALKTQAFWSVSLTCSLFLLVSSGTALFYEDILRTFGFVRAEYQTLLAVSFLIGTAFNLVCGLLAQRWSMTRLLGLASVVMAGTLVGLPFARTMEELYVYAAATGFVSGAVTVVFFAAWRPLFGATHVGSIQGAAQMLTVLASAVSQWLFPAAKSWAGSYVPLFHFLAAAALMLGLWTWFVPRPR